MAVYTEIEREENLRVNSRGGVMVSWFAQFSHTA
jgi:hypothetical protein